MSQITYREQPMEFDLQHALENFANMYDSHALMLVDESISNSLDAGASNIDIKIETTSGAASISFLDNGPGMNESQFTNYQKASFSTKDKKFGLGFAGIGAKMYVIAHEKSEIITETFNGKKQLACSFYVNDGVKTCQRISKHKFTRPGTLYKVILKPEDHYYLINNLESILIDSFNHAMLNGLNITINGNKIKPESPSATKQQTFTVSHKGKKLLCKFYLLKDDLAKHKRNICYQIMGKRICEKNLEFLNDVQGKYHEKIYVSVDALPIKSLLKPDKSSFLPGFYPYHRIINKEIHKITKKLGLLSNNTPNKLINNVLTKAFAKLFLDPKYAWLNPQGTGSIGCFGTGQPTSRGTSTTSTSTSHRQGGVRHRSKGGFAIGTYVNPSDKRDGWLDIANNIPMINAGHPLYIKFDPNPKTLQWHMARVVVSVLLLHGSMQRPMTMQEFTDLQTEILTAVKDELWL